MGLCLLGAIVVALVKLDSVCSPTFEPISTSPKKMKLIAIFEILRLAAASPKTCMAITTSKSRELAAGLSRYALSCLVCQL